MKTKFQKDTNNNVKNPILRISKQIVAGSVLVLFFLWFIDSIVSHGDVYLDVEITNNQLNPDTIYNSIIEKGGRYTYADTISKDKLTSIIQNISVKEGLNIQEGRQIWQLFPYTTGSSFKDFFPFFWYNDNYILYDIGSFKENVDYGNNLGRFFNPYGLSDFIVALFICLLFIILPILLFEFVLSLKPPSWILFLIVSSFGVFLIYVVYWDSFFFQGIRPFLKGTVIHVYVLTALVGAIVKIRKKRIATNG
jgi:hypothetical protein